MVLLGVHPDETSVLWLPLERKFGREVQENCSRQVLFSHPTLPCALGQVFGDQGMVQVPSARDDVCISGLLLELWSRDVKGESAH